MEVKEDQWVGGVDQHLGTRKCECVTRGVPWREVETAGRQHDDAVEPFGELVQVALVRVLAVLRLVEAPGQRARRPPVQALTPCGVGTDAHPANVEATVFGKPGGDARGIFVLDDSHRSRPHGFKHQQRVVEEEQVGVQVDDDSVGFVLLVRDPPHQERRRREDVLHPRPAGLQRGEERF